MARFSVSGAATAGFGVIARAPLAVLAWGLVMLVTLIGPMMGLMWMLIPQFIEIFKAMPDPASTSSPAADPAMFARMMQLQTSMMGLNAISLVGGTAIKAVVAGAVFRAVLQPDQKRWAYLRLGKSELWLALVTLVQTVLFMMAYFAVLIIGFILGMIVYMAGSAAGDGGKLVAGLLIGLVILAAIGVLLWGVLRLSMAGPMSFAEGKFLLFESWTFTRGQSGRLLGMAVLLALILMALELVVYAVVGVAVFGSWSGIAAMVEALRDQPPQAWLHAFWKIAAIGAVVLSFLAAFAMALICAPWAKAYQELAASGAKAS
ncbi:hypothetical protein ASD21_20895 [Caulobacter sp. Root1455]|uniref:hypothetical protein n=1 Tax=Caulobacter sp. Root1455 TaxID=1736465 RepID=UPI0006FE4490|nr:hypothetical protein [Caulobacter sp. Root1455]KQZ03262.1 hypothetical protein ASD21_20895 [Caulobacter sp. Root1455]